MNAELQGLLTTWEAVRNFVFAGNATFTLRSTRTGERFTYRVRVPKKSKNPSGSGPYFVSLLRGPSNEDDYAYMGVISIERMTLVSTLASRVSPEASSHKAFQWFLRRMAQGCKSRSDVDAVLEVWHEGRCGRCGRKLTVPESVAAGLGPECSGRMVAA